MQRREALRIFAAGAVLPALSPELFAMFRQAQPPPGYTMRTLVGHWNDTVKAMIDQIIPATDTPSASGARVHEFIDGNSLEDLNVLEYFLRHLRSPGLAGRCSRHLKE